MSNDLIRAINRLRDLMVAVSTGGPRIKDVNDEYRDLYARVDAALAELGLENPNPFPDLWDWFGRWSGGDLPSYQSRRQFLSEIFSPLVQRVSAAQSGATAPAHEPTGWEKVDRQVGEAQRRLAEAEDEEHYQAVGLLCREILISVAQAVHDPEEHPPTDGIAPSETDAKRMLEAYLAAELEGSSNAALRRQAKASYGAAVELQHKRTATFRQAALCLEATRSMVSVIAIVDGRRDPA